MACSMPQVVVYVAALDLSASTRIGRCNSMRSLEIKLWTDRGCLCLSAASADTAETQFVGIFPPTCRLISFWVLRCSLLTATPSA